MSDSWVKDSCGCWVVLYLGRVFYVSRSDLESHGGVGYNYQCHGLSVGGSDSKGLGCNVMVGDWVMVWPPRVSEVLVFLIFPTP